MNPTISNWTKYRRHPVQLTQYERVFDMKYEHYMGHSVVSSQLNLRIHPYENFQLKNMIIQKYGNFDLIYGTPSSFQLIKYARVFDMKYEHYMGHPVVSS